MQKVLFLVLSCHCFFSGSAQIPEVFHVHFDRDFYATGDDMWYKVYALNEDRVRSGVLYVDLIDSEGAVLASQKLKIEGNAAHGDFRIPPNWKEGLYTFRAYTNWSLNFGGRFVFSKNIPIYRLPEAASAFTAGDSESIDIQPFTGSAGSGSAFRLNVRTKQGAYRRGEQAEIEITTLDGTGKPIPANLSISVRDLDLVPPKSAADLIFQKKKRATGLLMDVDAPTETLHPVEEGLVLRTPIFSPEMRKVVFGTLPSVFLVDSRQKVRAELGLVPMTHLLPDFYGSRTIQYIDFFPLDRGADTYDMEVVPDKLRSQPAPDVALPRSPAVNKYLHLRQQQQKLEQVFALESLPPTPDFPPVPHAGKSDLTYLIDDYVTFGSMLEFVEEVISVPLIKVVREEGGPSLRMFNQGTNRRLTQAPLYLINDFVTFNEQAVLKIDWENVERIELFTSTVHMIEHFGALGVNGAVAVYTRDGETPGFAKNAGINARYDGYYLPRKFFLPPQTQGKAKLPDFRPLEYWNPDLRTDETSGKAVLTFPVSDAITRFLVHVEGISENGAIGVGEAIFEVKF